MSPPYKFKYIRDQLNFKSHDFMQIVSYLIVMAITALLYVYVTNSYIILLIKKIIIMLNVSKRVYIHVIKEVINWICK